MLIKVVQAVDLLNNKPTTITCTSYNKSKWLGFGLTAFAKWQLILLADIARVCSFEPISDDCDERGARGGGGLTQMIAIITAGVHDLRGMANAQIMLSHYSHCTRTFMCRSIFHFPASHSSL